MIHTQQNIKNASLIYSIDFFSTTKKMQKPFHFLTHSLSLRVIFKLIQIWKIHKVNSKLIELNWLFFSKKKKKHYLF